MHRGMFLWEAAAGGRGGFALSIMNSLCTSRSLPRIPILLSSHSCTSWSDLVTLHVPWLLAGVLGPGQEAGAAQALPISQLADLIVSATATASFTAVHAFTNGTDQPSCLSQTVAPWANLSITVWSPDQPSHAACAAALSTPRPWSRSMTSSTQSSWACAQSSGGCWQQPAVR